jgi:hypothetical protein
VKASLLKALGNVMPRHLLDTRLNPLADVADDARRGDPPWGRTSVLPDDQGDPAWGRTSVLPDDELAQSRAEALPHMLQVRSEAEALPHMTSGGASSRVIPLIPVSPGMRRE